MDTKKKKTVEEQIADADLTNAMERHFGEEGKEMAKDFLSLSENQQKVITTALGLTAILKLTDEERDIISLCFTTLLKKNNLITNMLMRTISGAIHRMLEEKFNSREEEDDNDIF